MRPLRLQCFSCVLTLRKVEIPTWAQRHIVRRHYPKRKHGKRSMSYEKVIPPHSLFNIVIDLLRSDLKASEKREFTLPIGSGTAECWDYVTSNKNVGLQTFISFYDFEPNWNYASWLILSIFNSFVWFEKYDPRSCLDIARWLWMPIKPQQR